MKGTVVVVVTGLATFMAVGAVGGALLVERAPTEETARVLAMEGVDTRVTFSGLTATVSVTNPEQLPTALRLVLDVPGVVRTEVNCSSLSTASISQPTTSTPALTSTPSPKPNSSEPTALSSPSPGPSPSPTSGEMPEPVVKFEGGESDFPSSERAKIIELVV